MKKQMLLTLLFVLLVTACAVDRKPYLLDMQNRYSHKNFIQNEEFLTKHEHQRMYSQMNNMLNVFKEIQINIESSKFSDKQLAKIDYEKSYQTLNSFRDIYLNTLKDSTKALESTQTALFFSKRISKEEETPLVLKTTNSTSSMVTVEDEYKDNYKELIQMSESFQKSRQRMESSLFTKEQLKKFPYQKAYDATYKVSKKYIVIGDFPRALESAHNALFYAKIISNQKESSQTIQAYKRIATIYKTTQNYAKASEYRNKVIFASKNIKGESTLVVSASISKTPKTDLSSLQIDAQKAVKYEKEGNYNEALKYLKKVVDKAEESLGSEHYMTANFYGKMSLNYLALNQPKKALPYATKALRIHKKIFGEHHLKTAKNYLNLSIVYLKMDKVEKAYFAMKESIETILESREALFSQLNKRDKLKNEDYNIGHFFYVASLYQKKHYAKKHKIAKETLDIWLRYKDEISNSESYLISLKSKTKDMEVKAKIDNLIETRKKYSSLYLKKISNEDAFSNSGKHEMKRLEEQKNHLESYLSSKIEEYKNSLKLKKIKSAQLSQKLQKNELYIDFAHIKHDNSYVSFILNDKNQVSLHRINSKGNKIVKSLESTVDKVLTFLLGGETENNSYAPMDVLVKGVRKDIIKEEGKNSFSRTNAKKLYRILLAEPYLDNLKDMSNVKKLIISPDGVLNLLPFEVLIDYDKYLIEEKKIIYVSSGKAFLKAHREKDSLSKNDDIVVFSYLDYINTDGLTNTIGSTEQTKSLVNHGTEVKRLSDTKDEAENIKDIFSQKNVHAYSGKGGTKEVLNALNSPKILHLSTHSFYGEDDKSDADSLLKSGMALSGYNNYISKLDTRGIMSALEFSNLNLYHTDLVLFSSCQSGRGNIHSSEGVYGLNKGAKLAGAKRVISTLWSVEAIASLKLTNRFYEHLKKNHMKGYANALRETKKEMINKAYHPFFWAGFVENGID